MNRFRGMENVTVPSKNLTEEQVYYNYNTMQREMGYYTTFFRTLWTAIKEHKANILAYRGSFGEQWEDMTEHERSNMRKMTVELSTMVFIGTLGAMLAGAAADADDDTLWFFAYLAKRQQNELMQFWNPGEAWRIIKNPIASVRQLETITNAFGLLFSTFEWDEVYESGPNEGQSKTYVKFLRTVQPSVFRFDAQRMYNFYDLN